MSRSPLRASVIIPSDRDNQRATWRKTRAARADFFEHGEEEEQQPRPRVSQALFMLLMDAREYPGIIFGLRNLSHSKIRQYQGII